LQGFEILGQAFIIETYDTSRG